MHKILLESFKQQDKDNYTNIYILNAVIIVLFIILIFTNKKESRLHYEIRVLNDDLEQHVDELKSLNNDMARLMDRLDKNVISSKTDINGVITYASYAFADISGYTVDELIGKTHNIVRHPDMPKEVFRQLWETIKEGKEWYGELKNLKKNKGYYWVEATISPEFNEEGEIAGYSAVRHDITAKKELEILSSSLEDQVRLRTKELEVMMEKVEKLSITDELTGLYNRRYYTKIMENEIRRSVRNKECFSYLLFDIDNFKLYNDFYGHHLGDVAIKKVADVFLSVLKRPGDFVFRMGGEEFVIVFCCENKQQAREFSLNIIDEVLSCKIEHLDNPPFNVLTLSGGLVSYEPGDDVMDEKMFYKKADKLLYLAKNDGRNCLRF